MAHPLSGRERSRRKYLRDDRTSLDFDTTTFFTARGVASNVQAVLHLLSSRQLPLMKKSRSLMNAAA
jgi:hypothetical protein